MHKQHLFFLDDPIIPIIPVKVARIPNPNIIPPVSSSGFQVGIETPEESIKIIVPKIIPPIPTAIVKKVKNPNMPFKHPTDN